MKRAEIDHFEKMVSQLSSIHQEISLLARKSPNDAVNEFKLKLINATLSGCNQLLDEAYRPFGDFSTFDSDELPSNSDVTFIVSQYLECAEKFRADHIEYDGYEAWYWVIDEKGIRIATSPPKKLAR